MCSYKMRCNSTYMHKLEMPFWVNVKIKEAR